MLLYIYININVKFIKHSYYKIISCIYYIYNKVKTMLLQLVATDVLALATMKNAAKCDT